MIEKMKAVCVVTLESHKDELLGVLRELEILHIAEKKSADPAILERFSMLSKVLPELKEYSDNADSLNNELSDEEFESVYLRSLKAIEQKNILKSKITELKLEYDRLIPWGEFNTEMFKSLPKNLDLHFYRLDKKAFDNISENQDVRFIKLASVEKMITVAVLGTLNSDVNAIEFVIPQKDPVQLKTEIADCEKSLLECENTLRDSAKFLTSYSKQILKSKNDVEFSAVEETLEKSDTIIWISGYIPEASEESFIQSAKEYNWAWSISEIVEDDEAVPTKIHYSKLTSIIKPVFDILGVVPGYKEYDISFWFLAFFALFFGMIIGDAGYGVLFLLGTVIMHFKTKKASSLTLLLYVLSFATVIWGSMTGTWFGLEGAMRIPFLKALVIPGFANYPEYFSVATPDVQNNVMKFCFSIGVIQLALACIMNIRRKCIEKNLSWVSDLGWLCSISALYFVVLNLVIGESINYAIVASIVGIGFLLVVLFGGMAPGKTFGQGLKSGLGDAFTVFLNTISAFGNIMSYIRLFAVGMASLAIAQSFNDMASGFKGVGMIIGIVIMVVGHLLNIIMGFLSVVVHGVRLNLLEFSGQLGMEWSGIAYEPFKKIKK